MQLLNTLYVTTPESWLRLDNDTIRVQMDGETRLRVPLHHLSSVVCLGNVGLSTPLIHRLADDGITLVLMDENGRFKARLEGSMSGNVLLRSAQHARANERDFGLDLSRSFIAGKIKNARQVLLRGARDTKVEDDVASIRRGADDLAASLRALPMGDSMDVLRGIEGEAARQYFALLGLLQRPAMREAFRMDGRTRRPPRDRINALLSFLYSMLMNDCRSALEAVGLDPQVGYLHVMRPGRAALALDLMEEFRAHADRLALTMINRSQISERDFIAHEGGAVLLEGDARKVVVTAYQERKQEELTHPLFAMPIRLGLLPLVQARLLARVIRGEAEHYLPFVTR